MLNRKYFPCPLAVKNYRQNFVIRGQFLHFKYMCGFVSKVLRKCNFCFVYYPELKPTCCDFRLNRSLAMKEIKLKFSALLYSILLFDDTYSIKVIVMRNKAGRVHYSYFKHSFH